MLERLGIGWSAAVACGREIVNGSWAACELVRPHQRSEINQYNNTGQVQLYFRRKKVW